jgi:Spy/CpxP family protein refolding chaperone
MRFWTQFVLLVSLAVPLYGPTLAHAEDSPATRPSTPSTQPRFERLERLKNALGQLDLDDNQRQQINDLISQFQSDIKRLRARREAGESVLNDRLQLVSKFRKDLAQILAPDQRLQLRQAMRGEGDASTQPSEKPPRPQSSTQPSTRPATLPAAVGSMAPPFRLTTPEGNPISLDRFKGRILVLEFGSLSSPPFRDHASLMQRLSQQYTPRVFFMIVYTREAHPAGQWDITRNQDDGIAIPQAKDMTARRNLASSARESLGFVDPVVVDTMDDQVANSYNGFPDATVIIGRDGKIAARQQWTDPSGLPRLIDALAKNK